jgi:hypothetical protein
MIERIKIQERAAKPAITRLKETYLTMLSNALHGRMDDDGPVLRIFEYADGDSCEDQESIDDDSDASDNDDDIDIENLDIDRENVEIDSIAGEEDAGYDEKGLLEALNGIKEIPDDPVNLDEVVDESDGDDEIEHDLLRLCKLNEKVQRADVEKAMKMSITFLLRSKEHK